MGKSKDDEVSGREADLLLATYYANELLLRCMLPTGLLREEGEKQPTQGKINALLEKIAKSYEVKVVQNTTCWVFERNEIEGKKKIVLAPTEGMKGEGGTDVGEAWGVEAGMSLGGGKVKDLEKRATLHRRTAVTYGLKRPSSRQILSEIVKKFGTFPFSLRQLDDERNGKLGVVECVRANVLREYKPSADADGSPVSRLWTTIAITKNGITRLAAPPALNLEKVKSDKKITDEEVLKILEKPLAKSTGAKNKNKKKKKPKKKVAKQEAAKEESEEDEDDDEDSDDE